MTILTLTILELQHLRQALAALLRYPYPYPTPPNPNPGPDPDPKPGTRRSAALGAAACSPPPPQRTLHCRLGDEQRPLPLTSGTLTPTFNTAPLRVCALGSGTPTLTLPDPNLTPTLTLTSTAGSAASSAKEAAGVAAAYTK